MGDRRYFLLREPIEPNNIESFLCRVVASKVAPLDRFAPIALPGTPAHETNDILPSILPQPTLRPSCDELFSAVRRRGFSADLSALLKVNVSRDVEQSRRLESKSVRRYTLADPGTSFQQLMKNEYYAKDVRDLLKALWPHQAYLVTGFLTATDSKWTIEESNKTTKGIEITLPVAEAAGVPVPGLANAGLGLSTEAAAHQSRKFSVVGEEIFAVSYSVAKLSYAFGSPLGFVTRMPLVGRPKLAKPHYLAMGPDDEEIEYDSDGETDMTTEAYLGHSEADIDLNQTITLDHQHVLYEAHGEMYVDV
ncbi:hypothetical protein GE09DRAFT_556585 [Coniochaeta sp. 2T2.1]|nr:hypothetical protein GE09DRAFT_556585 [Coniochaeta sp. 2T2.1]